MSFEPPANFEEMADMVESAVSGFKGLQLN